MFSLALFLSSLTAGAHSVFMANTNRLMVCILIVVQIARKLINFLIFNRKFVLHRFFFNLKRWRKWSHLTVLNMRKFTRNFHLSFLQWRKKNIFNLNIHNTPLINQMKTENRMQKYETWKHVWYKIGITHHFDWANFSVRVFNFWLCVFPILYYSDINIPKQRKHVNQFDEKNVTMISMRAYLFKYLDCQLSFSFVS